MADNVELDAGSGGATVAADDIGGVLYPRSKIVIGADGANDGDVSAANPLPVSGIVDASGSSVDASGSVITLGAGTAAFGKLSANSGVDIGDVDITSIAAGDNNIGNVDIVTVPTDPFGANADAASATGSISAKLRFIASTGIPVTGTVAVQESGTQVVADDAAFTPGTTKVVMAGFEADESSTDSVDEGDGGAARMTLDRKQIVTIQPHAAGGLSVYRSLDLDETEEDIKTSAGCLYKLRVTNRTTSVRYLKLYNDTAANVSVGTTTPLDTIPIPANASDYTVLTESFGGLGLAFSAALSAAVTTGFADSDAGAPGANDVIASFYYK